MVLPALRDEQARGRRSESSLALNRWLRGCQRAVLVPSSAVAPWHMTWAHGERHPLGRASEVDGNFKKERPSYRPLSLAMMMQPTVRNTY